MTNPPTKKPATNKQEAFALEYAKTRNATEAYAKIYGVKESVAAVNASRLLRNAKVRAIIDGITAEAVAETKASVEYVVENTMEVIERTMQRAPVLEYDREKKAYVQAKDENGNNLWTFDARGAVAALTLLSKHTGGFIERQDHTTNGKPIGGITWQVIKPLPGTSPRRLDAILAGQHNGNGNGHNGSG